MCHYIDISEATEEDGEGANEEQEEDKGGDDGAAEVTLMCNVASVVATKKGIHTLSNRPCYGLNPS